VHAFDGLILKMFRKALLVTIMTLLVLVVAVWWYLLGDLCTSPSAPNVFTRNTIPYNCHGSVVYISPLQQGLLHWLIPLGCVLVLAGHAVRKWQPHK
jgi:hypothetical protein